MRYHSYDKGKYDLAKDLTEELYKNIEPSEDEWDRGYNKGLRFAIKLLEKYQSDFRHKYNIKVDG